MTEWEKIKARQWWEWQTKLAQWFLNPDAFNVVE